MNHTNDCRCTDCLVRATDAEWAEATREGNVDICCTACRRAFFNGLSTDEFEYDDECLDALGFDDHIEDAEVK